MIKVSKWAKGLMMVSALAFGLFACVDDDFDNPPIPTLPEGSVITLQQMKDLCPPGSVYRFEEDRSLYAVVAMDDKSGNIYKSAYVQDNTGGINLFLKASGGLYQGDSVRIALKGLRLNWYQNLLQLDTIDVDKNIVKQKTLVEVAPKVVTIAQLKSGLYQSQLVKLEAVQFIGTDTAKTYADAAGLVTENRMLEDASGNQVIVRTSGYAKFAGSNVPNGSGSVIAIASQYRNDIQLFIRSTSEVDMNGDRLGNNGGGTGNDPDPVASLSEDFSSFTTGTGSAYFNTQTDNKGWVGVAVKGTLQPDLRVFNENKYVQFSAHRSSGVTAGDVQEFWAISPRLDISAASQKTLSFQVAAGYFNASTVFEVYILDSDNPATANKTKIEGWKIPTAADLNGSYTPFISSGVIDLSAYSGVKRIGFYYKGTSGSGNSTTYQLDNFAFGVGEPTIINVSPSTLSFAKEGEAKTFTVTGNTTWNAVSSDPTNFSVSVNGEVVTVTATENTTDAARSATITVTSQDNSVSKTVTCNQAGPAAPAGSNMLVNSSFEDFADAVPTSWNLGNSPNNAPVEKITTGAQDGNFAVKIAGTADGRCDFKQPVSGITPGKIYVISFWYKDNTKTAGSSGIRLWSNFTNGGAYVAPATDIKGIIQPDATLESVTAWTQFSVEVTAPAGVDGFNFEIRATKNNNGVIDNCSIVEKQ